MKVFFHVNTYTKLYTGSELAALDAGSQPPRRILKQYRRRALEYAVKLAHTRGVEIMTPAFIYMFFSPTEQSLGKANAEAYKAHSA